MDNSLGSLVDPVEVHRRFRISLTNTQISQNPQVNAVIKQSPRKLKNPYRRGQ
jgi:hypothetical protein